MIKEITTTNKSLTRRYKDFIARFKALASAYSTL